MHRAMFLMTGDCFAELLKGFQPGKARKFTIKENPLPEDAKIVDCKWDPENETVLFKIKSESFKRPEKGKPYPTIKTPILEVVFDPE